MHFVIKISVTPGRAARDCASSLIRRLVTQDVTWRDILENIEYAIDEGNCPSPSILSLTSCPRRIEIAQEMFLSVYR